MVDEAKPLPNAERPSVLSLSKSVWHFALGTLWLRLRWRTRALACLERALVAEPRQPIIRRYHAELLFQLDRLEEAVVSAEQLVGLTPEDPTAHRGLGSCLEKAERYEEALGAYERASELEPESLELKVPGLVCLLRLGRDGEFKERLGQLIQHDAETAELRAMMAMMLQTEGKFEEAGRWYQEAHRLEPENRVFENFAKIFAEPLATRSRKKRKRRRARR